MTTGCLDLLRVAPFPEVEGDWLLDCFSAALRHRNIRCYGAGDGKGKKTEPKVNPTTGKLFQLNLIHNTYLNIAQFFNYTTLWMESN